MWKNSLAIIVIGSLVASSSFATPLHVKNMFMKDKMMKSSVVTNKHQSSQFKFSGTWTGMCSSNDSENTAMKIRIDEDDTELSIIDLIDEGYSDTYSFNAVKAESNTDKDWYDSFTSRFTRINENTLKYEGTGVFGQQLPSSNEKEGFLSGRFISMYTINNSQLVIDTKGNFFYDNKDHHIETKCILKRADKN